MKVITLIVSIFLLSCEKESFPDQKKQWEFRLLRSLSENEKKHNNAFSFNRSIIFDQKEYDMTQSLKGCNNSTYKFFKSMFKLSGLEQFKDRDELFIVFGETKTVNYYLNEDVIIYQWLTEFKSNILLLNSEGIFFGEMSPKLEKDVYEKKKYKPFEVRRVR